jgi:hypothetical protein
VSLEGCRDVAARTALPRRASAAPLREDGDGAFGRVHALERQGLTPAVRARSAFPTAAARAIRFATQSGSCPGGLHA